jgi:hypothetical protein
MVYALLMFLGAAFAAANRRQTAKRTIVIGFALAVATMVALATSSITTRHYILEQVPALAIAMLVIAFSAMAGLVFVRSLGERLEGRKLLLLLFGTTIICALVIPTLFGSRMEARFDTVKQDLAGRLAHWQTAVEIMDDDWLTTLAGQGVGRFPERYFWIHQNATDVGGFRFDAENRNNFIRFHGAHDVRLGQRAALEPRSNYRIALDVRTEDPRALLYLRICHRQLIEASEWNPTCVQFKETIETTEGRWVRRSFDFDSGDLGSWKNLLRAPLVVTFSNRREYALNLRPQTVLDIDNITLTGLDGRQLLDNGDFESGIDRWFAYYDFNHLPWHIKNLWVHIFFEIGLVGLLLFLGLIFGAMLRAFRAARSDIFAGALFVSLCSFTTVGTFGTLVDAPRIGFLFFFVLLIASGLNLDSHRGQKTA